MSDELAVRPPFHIASICAGVGGLELGISLAVPHARTVVYVEREAFAVAQLVAHMEAGYAFATLATRADLWVKDDR